MKRKLILILTFLCYMVFSTLSQQLDNPEKSKFPQDISRMYQLKFGYSNDRLLEDPITFGSIRGDFRLKPMKSFINKDGYIQIQLPVSIYYFNLEDKNAFAFDVRFRPELG
ncbi:hypothetical protein ACFLRG_04020, partial [Bacteroidota bacterium]